MGSSFFKDNLSRKSHLSEVVEISDYLCQNLPFVNNITELITLEKRLKDVRPQRMTEIARRCYEPGDCPDRFGARDAAAQLALSIVRGSLNLCDHMISQKVRNDVLFIVSHARTFGPRVRSHVWKVFNETTSLTSKQQKQFDRWISEDGLSFDFYKDGNDDGSQTDGDCSTGSIHGYYDIEDEDY